MGKTTGTRPGRIVTAKQRANLRPQRGGSPGRPKKTKAMRDGEKFAKKIVDDPLYRRMLYNRARQGTLQPGVEALLIQMAYGKPKDTLEVSAAPVPVKIVHKYAVEKKPDTE